MSSRGLVIFIMSVCQLTLLSQVCLAVGPPEVTLFQGKLKGMISTTGDGFEYYSFFNIPYAKPPVGNLRFRDPQPADPWKGVFEANKEPIVCAQNDNMFFNKIYGVEDCLILNIFTPVDALSSSRLYPVMFWIHGGGYIAGSSSTDIYGPEYLVKKGVILVTINYRLASLGFLNLDLPEVPGNAGLKDQRLALRWVQKNIKKFGGNPDKVTIFGESAGSSSVEHLLAAPGTKGLISGAIAHSGSVFSDWAIQKNSTKTNTKFLNALNIKSDDKDELLNKLSQAPLINVLKAYPANFQVYKIDLPFVPSIEKSFPGVEPLITKYPSESYKSGQYLRVPIITGVNSNEGIFALFMRLSDPSKQYKTVDDFQIDFKTLIPDNIANKMDENEIQKTAANAKKYYFDNDKDLYQQYADALGSVLFMDGIQQMMETLVDYSDTYCYTFTYNGNRNAMEVLVPYKYKGASHFDEMGYLFNLSFVNNGQMDKRDRTMIENMTDLWTDFAKYGKPRNNFGWLPNGKGKINGCLEIDETIQMTKSPFPETLKFWTNLRKRMENKN